MTTELIINGKDAAAEYGVCMGDHFIEELLKPCALKGFVENADRHRDGKQVLYNDPRLADRDVTLAFNIHGSDSGEYLTNYRAFCALLQRGNIALEVPTACPNEVFRLTYLSSAGFSLSGDRASSTLSVKFNEPNPSNRLKEPEA